MRHRPLHIARSLPVGLAAGLCLGPTPAAAQDYGFDWVTIGDPGNPAYDDPWGGLVDGRGSVDYEYRIGRHEVTTGQWMEFVNTFSTQSDDMRLFGSPFYWGAVVDRSYGGPGRRYVLDPNIPEAGLLPVHGLDWRLSAMYCNWLHNGRSAELSAIEDGAYDTSTFTRNSDGSFNDQLTRHSDAKFWIPSLDEWVKAAHYDPDRFGQGEGGWWTYANGSDDPLVPGMPGEGDTSATLEWAGAAIPLGAYPHAASPWGLLDLSGGTMEWTEEMTDDRRFRWADGAPLFAFEDYLIVDTVDQMGMEWPSVGGTWMGLRVAAPVPSSSTGAVLLVVLSSPITRRRRS
jgi:formylglycine-generating enzyme required for sulfatase activity